jgi:drug/metabolite transporter (DMT)-like permease
VLSIAFTVAFNVISRLCLSATKYEHAYTILWQVFCGLLALLLLPFDTIAVTVTPHGLLLFALSVALWALADAFLFSAYKYEEASVLSAILPLNFVVTFVVSVLLFHVVLKPTILVGFLIIMLASFFIGVYHMNFRPSKGVVFALLCSVFTGAALGYNSVVVKSFSIPPYMFAAFFFPAIVNWLVFLRPKGAELRYEFHTQWKAILLNAVVMDASFFCLLKAFQMGNVPQLVPLSASSTLLTALAGIIFLGEKKHITIKLLAAGLATVGIVLVQL